MLLHINRYNSLVVGWLAEIPRARVFVHVKIENSPKIQMDTLSKYKQQRHAYFHLHINVHKYMAKQEHILLMLLLLHLSYVRYVVYRHHQHHR